MFADPQTVTINAVAKNMPRISSSNPSTTGSYSTPSGDYTVRVSQNTTANRFRREVRLTQTKIAVDPISAVNKQVSTSVIIAVDEPRWGFDDTELGYLTSGLVAWFTAANRDKLLGGEL